LHLWQAINNERESLSNTQFKKTCLANYWSVARVFEWRELYFQLSTLCKEMGWKTFAWSDIDLSAYKQSNKKQARKNQQFDERYEQIHKALLAGLVGNIATKDIDENYTATRGRKVHLFPGSAQSKSKPKWLMCTQLLETSRLFAHTIAQIKPEWIIENAEHLCKYSYSEANYHARSGAIKAKRKTLLYGLVLRDKESINYGPINPAQSHEIFIQQALVEAQYRPTKKGNFFEHNQKLIKDIEKLETKTRRRNLLISEQTLYNFYAEHIPKTIYNRANFEHWLWQKHAQIEPNEQLKLNREQLLTNPIEGDAVAQFPDKIKVHGKAVTISYQFNPGQAQDGITMIVPISVLSPFPNFIGDWLVPGLLREKCIALIKTLPKQYRRHFAPAADAIDRIYSSLIANNEALHKVLAKQLFATFGVKITPELFDLSKLDDYYRMNYRIIDVDGSLVDEDRDLVRLKRSYANSVQKSVHADNTPEKNKLEKHNIKEWNFGPIAELVEYQHQGMTVTAYPCLKINDDESLSLIITDQLMTANYHNHNGILRLTYQVLSNGQQRQANKYLQKELFASKHSTNNKVGLSNLASQLKQVNTKPANRTKWVEEVMLASIKQCCFNGELSGVRNEEIFNQKLQAGAKNWVSICMEFEHMLSSCLNQRDQILSQINAIDPNSIAIDQALEEIKSQLYDLFEPYFLRYTSLTQLKQYPRFLKAIESRLERLNIASKNVDQENALRAMQAEFHNTINTLNKPELSSSVDYVYLSYPNLHEFALSLQEWRVSIFAQHLKTLKPVSAKRLINTWQTILDELNQF